MSDQNMCSCDTKQINELDPLHKLNGKEQLLIDNGDYTLNITVDTLMGYIRDQINSGGSGSSSSGEAGSTIHIIKQGEPDIPAASRPKGHYYLRVVDTKEAQLATGLPRLITVGPNMRIRMLSED